MARLIHFSFSFVLALSMLSGSGSAEDSDAIDIADRRELFVDNYLVEALDGEARQILHRPILFPFRVRIVQAYFHRFFHLNLHCVFMKKFWYPNNKRDKTNH